MRSHPRRSPLPGRLRVRPSGPSQPHPGGVAVMPAPPTNAGLKRPPEPLTAYEVRALLSACSTRYSSGIRMRALIGVLYGAGLRVSEALALKPPDVDPNAGTIRVRHGKGDKSRVVGIDPHGAALLETWMQHR